MINGESGWSLLKDSKMSGSRSSICSTPLLAVSKSSKAREWIRGVLVRSEKDAGSGGVRRWNPFPGGLSVLYGTMVIFARDALLWFSFSYETMPRAEGRSLCRRTMRSTSQLRNSSTMDSGKSLPTLRIMPTLFGACGRNRRAPIVAVNHGISNPYRLEGRDISTEC